MLPRTRRAVVTGAAALPPYLLVRYFLAGTVTAIDFVFGVILAAFLAVVFFWIYGYQDPPVPPPT